MTFPILMAAKNLKVGTSRQALSSTTLSTRPCAPALKSSAQPHDRLIEPRLGPSTVLAFISVEPPTSCFVRYTRVWLGRMTTLRSHVYAAWRRSVYGGLRRERFVVQRRLPPSDRPEVGP